MKKSTFLIMAIFLLILTTIPPLVMMFAPTSDTLDTSWAWVLGYAFSNNLQWGKQIIFTYGPLGFNTGMMVIEIKPGFVYAHYGKFRKGMLWASSEKIGDGIYQAINRKRDVVYLPWFWRSVILVIRLIPERFFKHLAFNNTIL
jgi:hypothetical protein